MGLTEATSQLFQVVESPPPTVPHTPFTNLRSIQEASSLTAEARYKVSQMDMEVTTQASCPRERMALISAQIRTPLLQDSTIQIKVLSKRPQITWVRRKPGLCKTSRLTVLSRLDSRSFKTTFCYQKLALTIMVA